MPIDNNVFQKNANTSLVANLIWKERFVSRADIARKLNLYRSTVTNITSFLLESGVIREGIVRESTQLGGRRAVELSVNPSFGCVFGFDIQPSHYRAVILQANGNEIWRKKGSFGNISLEEMLVKVVDLAFEANRQFNLPIIAISFAVPGIVDDAFSTIIRSFPFYTANVDVRSIVCKKYGYYPVFVENDANSAAWLDIYSHCISGNAISIVSDFHEEAKTNPKVVGIGTGVGVIVNGKVYRGSHNGAGEFKTISWRDGLNNQSGLPADILRRTQDDSRCLELWVEDTFKSFVSVFSVMDFEKVLFHGNPFSDEKWITGTIRKRVPEFFGILENTGCSYIFDSLDECVSARGAAMMCLQNLFSIPDLRTSGKESESWEKTVAFLKSQCK